MLIPACICGSGSATAQTHHGLDMLCCDSCGILRQNVQMTEAAYAQWYRERYYDGIYYHTYEQDAAVAESRLAAYQLPKGSKLLDVGAGNGAFVMAANAAGLDAWGQDLALLCESERVYVGPLESIAFPAASFDVVTMHDVLEHIPNPRAFLHEVSRLLVPGGNLILDFPRFHHPAGVHHWKLIEHLWMLDEPQLQSLLKSEGFRIRRHENPIESKIVLTTAYVRLPSSKRILVPAGIGDGYWVLTKLRAFIEARSMYLPEIWVHGAGVQRAEAFWRAVPFVRFGGYAIPPHDKRTRLQRRRHMPPSPAVAHWEAILSRAYKQPGFAIQENVLGFDYFISLNGTLENGQTIDEGLPGPTEWYPQLFRSKAQAAHRSEYAKRWGRYVVAAFWDQGFYGKFLAEFGEPKITAMLRRIADAGFTVVIMGAEWDKAGIGPRLAATDPRFVDLVGATDFDALMGLLDGAAGVIGFPAGNTLLGPYFRRPTVLLWNEHFTPGFWQNCTAPSNGNYAAVSTRDADPTKTAARLLAMIG